MERQGCCLATGLLSLFTGLPSLFTGGLGSLFTGLASLFAWEGEPAEPSAEAEPSAASDSSFSCAFSLSVCCCGSSLCTLSSATAGLLAALCLPMTPLWPTMASGVRSSSAAGVWPDANKLFRSARCRHCSRLGTPRRRAWSGGKSASSSAGLTPCSAAKRLSQGSCTHKWVIDCFPRNRRRLLVAYPVFRQRCSSSHSMKPRRRCSVAGRISSHAAFVAFSTSRILSMAAWSVPLLAPRFSRARTSPRFRKVPSKSRVQGVVNRQRVPWSMSTFFSNQCIAPGKYIFCARASAKAARKASSKSAIPFSFHLAKNVSFKLTNARWLSAACTMCFVANDRM
mmetsp:Transcript_34455/g.109439  ORF Transcript_34455/g.109439 Transcript_34455/m.109439 type:complete len:340 (+) Transcript_34455:719-1738(+)